MKTCMTAIFAIASLALSAGALAQNMSKSEYKEGKKNIAAEYRSAKVDCRSFAGNAKDVCQAEATGGEAVATAELDARYEPSNKANHTLSVARAQAAYAVAMEKCDDKASNDKDVCVKVAKAALVDGKADAKAQLTSSQANAKANETVSEARTKAQEIGNAARQDAAIDKREAHYAVAKEKCDALAGAVKTHCMSEANLRHGK